MLKVEFQFQTAEEATAAIQAVSALTHGTDALAVAPPAAAPVVAMAPPAPVAAAAPAPQPAVAPAAPVTPPAPTTPPAAVPVAAAPTFSREQIMTAGATLIDAGKMDALMALLNKFGVQAVTMLKEDQLGAFATELRALGAQI